MERGAWQKKFVTELRARGLSGKDAMAAMVLAVEEKQQSYMLGYDRGYGDRAKEVEKKFDNADIYELSLRLQNKELSIYSCVVLARRDMAAGNVKFAIHRLRSECDKLRMYDVELVKIINKLKD